MKFKTFIDEATRKPEHTHAVTRGENVISYHTSSKSAHKKADSLDNQYGSTVHSVKLLESAISEMIPYALSAANANAEQVAEGIIGKKKPRPPRYSIYHKSGQPALLASWADKDPAIKYRDENHPGAEVRLYGPRGKLKQTYEETEQVEEGYKGRKAFGSAYDKTHDPFQDSKRTFKSRELEHELAHEAPSGPSHHDQTPHDVHIDGKKWKTFGSAGHAHNVANKLSISGKKASVHKTPIAEKAPPGWEGTVKAMKKHSEIDNPFALAWWMKRQGAKSHKGEK